MNIVLWNMILEVIRWMVLIFFLNDRFLVLIGLYRFVFVLLLLLCNNLSVCMSKDRELNLLLKIFCNIRYLIFSMELNNFKKLWYKYKISKCKK